MHELRTADGELFSYCVVSKSEVETYLNCVVECVYDKNKADQEQRKLNYLIA